MSKKFNNKILLGVLGVLVLVFFLTRYFRDKERSAHAFRTELVTIDSAAVEMISIFPQSAGGEEIKFSKNAGQWQVESKGIVSEPTQGAVQGIIAELQTVKPQRLAARTKEQWEKYSLTDSMATRVTVTETGKSQTLDLYIGKFSYRQQPGGMQQFGNRGISGITYVRLGSEEAVYATEGFLAMSFNRGFNAWRRADFLKAEKPAIQMLRFDYPADSSFVVAQVDSVWMVGEEKADSMAIENYLNLLTNRQERNFADEFRPDTLPDYTLTVSGEGMADLVVQCWTDTTGQYYLHASINLNAYFSSPATGVFKQLFVGKEKFLPKEDH